MKIMHASENTFSNSGEEKEGFSCLSGHLPLGSGRGSGAAASEKSIGLVGSRGGYETHSALAGVMGAARDARVLSRLEDTLQQKHQQHQTRRSEVADYVSFWLASTITSPTPLWEVNIYSHAATHARQPEV